MSVQHRSRIKTVADYSPYLSDVGGCCHPDAEPDGAVESTYQDCISNNGYFVPGDGPWECPDLSTKGCCCACSYVEDWDAFIENSGCNNPIDCPGVDGALDCYNGGLKEVTECECMAVGGNWAGAGSSCSTYFDDVDGSGIGAYILCNPEQSIYDVRWPGACCNYGECTNVCSSTECSDIVASGDTPDPDAAFYEFFTCGQDLFCERDSAPCADAVAARAGRRNTRTGLLEVSARNSNQLYEQRENVIKRGLDFPSACIYKNEDGVIICGNETEKVCNFRRGHWAGLGDGGVPHSCNSTIANDLLDYITNSKAISRHIVDRWNLGESVLGLDGRYAGEIRTKSTSVGVGTEVFGNSDTGQAQLKRISSFSKNRPNQNKNYAIIVSNRTTHNSLRSSSEQLRRLNSNYFIWSLPDLDTLSFLCLSVKDDEFVENTTSITTENVNNPFDTIIDDYYLSCDNLKINRKESKDFVHIQNLSNGYTSTCRTNSLRLQKAIIAIEIKEN